MYTHEGRVDHGLLFVQATIAVHPELAAISGGLRSRQGWLKVDTGASGTHVTRDFLETLNVQPSGTIITRNASQHVEERPAYRVVIGLRFIDLSNHEEDAALALTVAEMPPMPKSAPANMPIFHAGLLGMDYLRHFRLLADGPGQAFKLQCTDIPRQVRGKVT